MGDMGDLFNEWNKDKQEKRARNRISSAAQLEARGYQFEEKNWGAHLIVTAAHDTVIDFWPGTGKWIARTSKGGHAQSGRGVMNLIKQFPPKEKDDGDS